MCHVALFMAVGLGVVVNHLSSQALQRSYRDSIIQNTRNISSVLFVVMEGNFFTKVLASQTTDYETNTWFVDTDGNTIGDADFQNVINGENILTSAETDKGYMALSEIYKDAFQGKTDAKTYTYSNNEKYYCGYTPVKGYPWFLFFEISYMKLQKGLRL